VDLVAARFKNCLLICPHSKTNKGVFMNSFLLFGLTISICMELVGLICGKTMMELHKESPKEGSKRPTITLVSFIGLATCIVLFFKGPIFVLAATLLFCIGTVTALFKNKVWVIFDHILSICILIPILYLILKEVF